MGNNRGSSSSGWTNERHVDFLNSMEASFVRTNLIINNNINNNNNNNFVSPPPLDRYLPDSSDSTLDSYSQRRAMARRRHSTSGNVVNSVLNFIALLILS